VTLAPTLIVFASFATDDAIGNSETKAEQSTIAAPQTQADIDNLLVRVRQHMSAGELQRAEELLERAERAKPRYPVLHFGDTPSRVRRDLEKLQSNQNTVEGAKNSKKQPSATPGISLPGLSRKNNEIVNPFTEAERNAAQDQQQSTQSGNKNNEGVSAAHVALPTTPQQAAARRQSDQALLAARRSLIVGDVQQARTHLANAKEQSVEYAPHEDSPERVAQSIAELEQLEKSQDDSTVWRQGYAKFLVTQADTLIGWGDLNNAERAASEAAGLYTMIGVDDVASLELLSRIQKLRTQRSTSTESQSTTLAKSNATENSPNATPQSQAALDKTDQNVKPATAAVPLDLSLPNFESATSEDEATPQRLAQSSGGLTQLPAPEEVIPETADAATLLEQGEAALRSGDRNRALQLFRQAHSQQGELDTASQKQLQDHLQMLSVNPKKPLSSQRKGSFLDSASEGQTVVARQLAAEVGKRQTEAMSAKPIPTNRSRY